MIGRLSFVTTLIIFACAVAWGQSRIEIRPIETLTVSTQQFLVGDPHGQPATLAGELRLPIAPSGKLPAVILLHGSEGLQTHHARWAEELNGIGIAVLLLDSFAGRGITNTSDDHLASLSMMIDAYRALALLAQHSRIDPQRIAIMGFSKGGIAAVYSGTERFRRMYAPSRLDFVAHIGMYMWCGTRYRDDDKVTAAPIRLFHGTADDWTPIEPCHDYAARLQQAGADAKLIAFQGAPHAYDTIGRKNLEPLEFPTAQTARNCSLVEGDGGIILNSKTGKPFNVNDECVQKGTHIGYDEAATVATVKAVKEFLVSVFNLKV
jgi:dienelactone hydrolase